MPKIKITEIDNTGNIQLSSTSNVVYIPGLSASGNIEPTLYGTANELKKLGLDSGLLVNDDSYKLAYRLLQLGMPVLYEGVEAGDGEEKEQKTFKANIFEGREEVSGNVYKYFKVQGIGNNIEFVIDEENSEIDFTYYTEETLASGSQVVPHELSVAIVAGVADFSSVIETYPGIADIITLATINPSYNVVEYKKFVVVKATSIKSIDWTRLEDKNAYNIRFLTTGAYALDSADVAGMITCAENRGDCVALIDTSKDSKTVDEVRQDINAKVGGDGSEYCASFVPWLDIRMSDGQVVTLPGSAGYLLAYANSVQTNPTWYAVAGSFRGNIPGLVEPCVKYSKSECEQLQARASSIEVGLDDIGDNVGIAINPICNIRPFGYIVFGNRTLRNNPALEDGTGNTTATSFLNVRNLVSTLKKRLYEAANRYTFEQNNETLWINFKSQVTPLLDQMQSGNGIEGYKFIRQATDRKARLKAKIVIIPIEAVEDFELEVSLEDSLEVVEQ